MTLTKYLSVVPSSHSTSYYWVSRSGLLCACPIVNPFALEALHFTVAMFPPLLVSSSIFTVTLMYLSKLPISSTSGCGSSIILMYSVSVGVVLSYHNYGYHVSHCGIYLPSSSTTKPSKSSIMKLVSSKRSINALSNSQCNIWVRHIIPGGMLHSCFYYFLARDWHYPIWNVATYPLRYSYPSSNWLILISHSWMISCMTPHKITEIKVYILQYIWYFYCHCFNGSSVNLEFLMVSSVWTLQNVWYQSPITS